MSKRENPVDQVLDRMVEAALGENAHFKSHGEALGIPEETVKTWRRRGAVPAGYLSNFARDWKTSVDYLLHGPEGVMLIEAKAHGGMHHAAEQQAAAYGLTDEERKLLENYRKVPAEVKEALQLVASVASRPMRAAIAAPASEKRMTKTAVMLETEHKGKRRGPRIAHTEYTGKRTGPTISDGATKPPPKRKREDQAS